VKPVWTRYFIATLLGACLAGPAWAVGAFTEAALAAARHAFPDQAFDERNIVRGELNHDGLQDFAVLTDGPALDGVDERPLRIVVFLGKKDGGFQAPIVSGDTFRHPAVDQELKVMRHSLFLTRSVSGVGSETFQFSMKGGVFVLVGEETNFIRSKGFAVDDEQYGDSINFLTHVVISWRINRKIRKESRKTFLPSPPIKLQDFDYLDHLKLRGLLQ